MPTKGERRPRTGWWPLLAWGGDLHVTAARGAQDRLDEEIRNATLARLDALVVPALQDGVPWYDSQSCRVRGRIRRFPWQRRLRRDGIPPFQYASTRAAAAGLRVWAQMDILSGGLVDFRGPSLGRTRPRWTVWNAQGRPTPIGLDREHFFLCPSHKDVVRLYCEVAVEICTQFPVSALVLDLRAAPREHGTSAGSACLCFHCQARAEDELGLDLQEVLDDGTPEVFDEWRAWRAGIWQQLVRTIRSQVWTVRPGLPVFVRIGCDRSLENGDGVAEARGVPTWLDWARSGLVEMVLLDQSPGVPTETERHLVELMPKEDLDCLFFPMFHEAPGIARPENWARAFQFSLPGWGLTQHLAEAWSSAILFKPGPRHGDASTHPALEVEPLAACIESLFAAEELLGDVPLAGDVRSIRATLLTEGRRLDLPTLDGLVFQLSTLVTMLDQEREGGDTEVATPRGWVELARRLLRWHANLHCQELYLFDAG